MTSERDREKARDALYDQNRHIMRHVDFDPCGGDDAFLDAVAAAIAAEREACAKVADDHAQARRPYEGGVEMADAIADAIRARGEE